MDGVERQWEADVVLRDGATMHLRPMRPTDANAVHRLHAGQSDSSIYYRFFAPRARLSERDVASFTDVDQHDDVSLGIFSSALEGGELVAIGGFNTTGPGIAEVAFYVADSQHGRGLGSVLLDHLAGAARDVGISHFSAYVLPANRKMINVFKDAGYRLTTELDDGVIEITIDLRSTDQSWRVMVAREQHSESQAMAKLMHPRLVVAIEDKDTLLAEIAHNAPTVTTCAEFDSLLDIRDALALVNVPVDQLAAEITALGERGVAGAVVYSGAGAVSGDVALQLWRAARSAGVRLIGPASAGIITGETQPYVTLQAPSGDDGLDVFVQSAEVAAHLFDELARADLKVHSALTAGYRLDISGNDTMQYWAANPRTQPALICLDTIGNARKFVRVARHLATQRPVIALITAGTAREKVPGHMVTTSKTDPQVLPQLLAQAGVIATRHLPEMVQLARFAATKIPHGGRIGAITSSEILTTVVRTEVTREQLTWAGVVPWRLAAGADGGDCEAIRQLDLNCDVVIIALTAVNAVERAHLDAAIAALTSVEKTAMWVAVIGGEHRAVLPTASGPIPHVDDIGQAVWLLSRLIRAADRRSEIESGQLVDYGDLRPADARALVRTYLHTPTDPTEAARAVLATYGIEILPHRSATNVEESVEIANAFGYPVVVKSQQLSLRHRTDLGGIALDVGDSDAVRAAVARFKRRGEQSWDIQPMAPTGAACVIRAIEDPLYGPVLSFALAGDGEEILHDVSYRIAPLTQLDAEAMINDVAASVRLHGYKGVPPLDVGSLAELIGRISMLKDDIPQIAAIDLHPVIVGTTGVKIAGASLTVRDNRRRDDARRALPTPQVGPRVQQ
ncbi:MAG: GNAT family N-acetyltransferase [Bowdeniella nasicola]|nr:GNAT family N-acetyltransferase [Bowdeniella nasicola]